jgi:CubicO group peptidase (beta-lactamase class C family)
MKKLFFISLLITVTSFSQITEKQIDEVAENTLKAFNVPGVAVAVVKDGKIIHSKGYGVKSILKKDKVDGNTLFGVASNSKAFTTAAIAMLVDEGKMNWDDKVVKYLPNFKMYNRYVTPKWFRLRRWRFNDLA